MDGLTNTSPSAKPATGAQQEQFDLILGRARQMMGETGEEWLQALKVDPVQAAVTMGTHTVRELVGMSEKAGQPVDPAVLFHVGVQFVKDIAGVANAAGVVPDAELPTFLKDVMSQSLMEYIQADAKDGLIKPQDKKAADGLLAQMQGGEPAGEAPEPAGEAPGPDNTPVHENAETPAVEQVEGAEEDGQADDPEMAAQLAALRAKRGA